MKPEHIQKLHDDLNSGSGVARMQAMDWISRNAVNIFQALVDNTKPPENPPEKNSTEDTKPNPGSTAPAFTLETAIQLAEGIDGVMRERSNSAPNLRKALDLPEDDNSTRLHLAARYVFNKLNA